MIPLNPVQGPSAHLINDDLDMALPSAPGTPGLIFKLAVAYQVPVPIAFRLIASLSLL